MLCSYVCAQIQRGAATARTMRARAGLCPMPCLLFTACSACTVVLPECIATLHVAHECILSCGVLLMLALSCRFPLTMLAGLHHVAMLFEWCYPPASAGNKRWPGLGQHKRRWWNGGAISQEVDGQFSLLHVMCYTCVGTPVQASRVFL